MALVSSSPIVNLSEGGEGEQRQWQGWACEVEGGGTDDLKLGRGRRESQVRAPAGRAGQREEEAGLARDAALQKCPPGSVRHSRRGGQGRMGVSRGRVWHR